MADKEFFRSLTKNEIKKKEFIEVDKIIDILNLKFNQYTIFDEFIPRGFDSPRKFMKHGSEVKPKRFYSLEQTVQDCRTPVQLREEAFNNINKSTYCAYTILPLGRDKRKRKICLYECLEGARIYAYVHHNMEDEKIKLKVYRDAKRVRIDGADAVIEVPSRTKGAESIQFKLTSVPIIDSNEKYKISLNLGSDHSCKSKRFNIRYRYTDDKEGSGIFNFCAHEIAGYLELVDNEWENHKNIIPLQMSQFAIPSQLTVDYYLKLENNLLIRDKDVKGDNLRKAGPADKEIALWNLVKNYGHDKTFFSKNSRDGNLRDYKWRDI